jgi:hypothetical protein
MPKGIYTRCQISEWDPVLWCKRKATATSWLHEPYYTDRKYFPLCASHNDWLERPETEYDLYYDSWLKLHNA